MRPKLAISDQLGHLAGAQHGVVSLQQLLALGLGTGAVKHRLRSGQLHRVHRGVYAVGHAGLGDEGRWMAAVLAIDPARRRVAALSHRAAAGLWQVLSPAPAPFDVTVLGHGGRAKRRGIRLHRSSTLTVPETTLRLGIPVTTPARTLADLRRCVSPHELGRAWRQAEVLGYPLDHRVPEPEPARSELERRFLALCRRHRLPGPEVNVAIGRHVVDFLWREPRLIVETDGYRYHRGRATFEHDHRRQAQLVAAGYAVLRFTWRQVAEEPHEVVAALRSRLP